MVLLWYHLLSRPKKVRSTSTVSYISDIYIAVELFAARATNPRVQSDRNFALKTEFRYLNGFWRERERSHIVSKLKCCLRYIIVFVNKIYQDTTR